MTKMMEKMASKGRRAVFLIFWASGCFIVAGDGVSSLAAWNRMGIDST